MPTVEELQLYINQLEHKLQLLQSERDTNGEMISRRQAEAGILEERNLMRALIDNLPDAIYFMDEQGRFVICNMRQAQLCGKSSPEEVIGKTDLELFPELGAIYYRDDMEIITTNTPLLSKEEKVIDPTNPGRMLWLSVSKLPLKDQDGNIIGLVGIGRDITKLKLAEEASRKQLEIIEAQQQTLFELSTPIIPIIDQIIVMPLIGAIDTDRAQNITRALLAGIGQYRAKFAILDITGVPIVDSGVADHLNRTMQAARLKGAYTIVTGISDAVAETIVDLGIDWSKVETLRDLQSGLLFAFGKLGIDLNLRSRK